MAVMIIKHVENEGPGTMEEYLRQRDIRFRIIELYKGVSVPSIDDFDTIVILGGVMSVNDGEHYPFITEELGLLREALKGGKRLLGICLGAQLIAKSLGGRVFRGDKTEVGWCDIDFSRDGLMDPIIRRLALDPYRGDILHSLKVFQWHSETFDLPKGAVHLASSGLYPNQAFRYDHNVYAFQFHIEVTQDMIFDWMKDEAIDKDRLKRDTYLYYEALKGRAFDFYEAFFSV